MKQVLIKFRTGEHTLYTVGSEEDFHSLVRECSHWLGSWIYIGKHAVVRKKDVSTIYYLPEGYDNVPRIGAQG